MKESVTAFIEEIEGRKNRGHGLAHFLAYMKSIGNPHQSISSIHVAGTNGKGSTVNYIRSMLQEQGYKVGSFTSPYLETHRDRIRINDAYISEEQLYDIATRYYDGWMNYDLSMFEIDMAIACIYYKEEACDICVFEVGLGGRKDATNIITPLLSLITNIGMDHMELLGDTKALIAKEKGGIIKHGVPFVTSEELPECLAVFQAICTEKQATLDLVASAQNIILAKQSITFTYKHMEQLHLQDCALYQINNASLAIEAMLQLRKLGWIIQDESIYQGISIAKWKGRFETVYEHPWVILDGAHNEEGIQALAKTLATLPPVRILFAALKDKDTKAMMQILCNVSDDVSVTEFPFYRSQKASILGDGFDVNVLPDFKDAIQSALLNQEQPLVITGSLYFIAQVREYIQTLR